MGEPALKYSERYTVENWEHWSDRWELIYGFPYNMSPSPSYEHQDINVNIVAELKQKFKECGKCKAVMAFDWQISEDTIVQPDVSVSCGAMGGKRLFEAPDVVFEILSPSTEKKDRTVKFDLYQGNKVGYYVIVDPEKKSFEIFQLKNKKFERQNADGIFQFDLKGCLVNFDFMKIW